MRGLLNFSKNLGRKAAFAAGGVFAVLLALVVIVMILLQGLLFWLNTERGGSWLSAQIDPALQEAGYRLELEGFSLAGLMGIEAKRLALYEGEILLLSGEDISLRAFPIFPARAIDITVEANMLSVHNFPDEGVEHEGQVENVRQDTIIPDLFFNDGWISLTVQNLIFEPGTLGDGFQAGLYLSQEFEVEGQRVSLYGTSLFDKGEDAPLYIPRGLTNMVSLDTETQTLRIEELVLDEGHYRFEVEGLYNLADQNFETALRGILKNGAGGFDMLEAPVDVEAGLAGKVQDFAGNIEVRTEFEGTEPVLNARVERAGPLITFAEITSRNSPISLSGAVDYNLETSLASGTVSARAADLALAERFLKDVTLQGAGTADLILSEDSGVQAARLSARIQNFQFDNMAAQIINLSASLKDISDPEAFEVGAEIKNAELAGIDLSQLTAGLMLEDGVYRLTMQGEGYSIHPFSFEAALDVRDFAAPDLSVSKAVLSTAKGQVSASGNVAPDRLDVVINAADLQLSQMAFADLSSLPVRLDEAEAHITGNFKDPVLKASYSLYPLNEDYSSLRFKGEASYDAAGARADITGEGKGIETFKVSAALPMSLSLRPFAFDLAEDAPLEGRFDIQSNLQALAVLFLNERFSLSGRLDGGGVIGGTVKSPSIQGRADVRNARFEDTAYNLLLTDIHGRFSFQDNRIEIAELSALGADEQGSARLTGRINLQNTVQPDIDLSLVMNNMHLLKGRDYDAILNADLAAQTRANGYLLSGMISPEDVSIRIPEQLAGQIPSLNIVEAEQVENPQADFLEKIRLDLEFRADNRIFVSGRGLDAEFQGVLDIAGNADTPIVEGNLEILRGRYEEFGRRFALDRAALRFQGAVPPSPYLDVEAVTDVEGISAKILISGSAQNPGLSLASVPTLPEDEILSLILFGKDIRNITPFQAVRLANTLRRFSGQGGGPGFDPLQELQNLTGLDDIRVDGVGTENTSVGAGKYISDDVYLEIEQGTGEGSGAASVEVEVTPNISVESKAAQSGESDIGVFWEWNY